MWENVFAAALFSSQYMQNYYYDNIKIYPVETSAEN
jgi:hypothetical protein